MKFKNYIYLMLGLSNTSQSGIPEVNRVEIDDDIPEINRVEIVDDIPEINRAEIDMNEDLANTPTLNRIILLITWFMVIASSLLILAIIVFGIIGKEAPSILSQLLLVMVGYLGGVIASYVRFAVPDEKGK